VRRYAERVSGPVFDRIDIHQHLRPLRRAFLKQAAALAEPSAAVAGRVLEARRRQRRRLAEFGLQVNAEVSGAVLRKKLPLPEGVEILEKAAALGQLSARGVDKTLRIAWSVGDLAGAERPAREHLETALAMRRGEERDER
jgi:magnesium chelatase family protein